MSGLLYCRPRNGDRFSRNWRPIFYIGKFHISELLANFSYISGEHHLYIMVESVLNNEMDIEMLINVPKILFINQIRNQDTIN